MLLTPVQTNQNYLNQDGTSSFFYPRQTRFMFTCVLGYHAASTVLLVPKPFGAHWQRLWAAAQSYRMPVQWHHQFWQSLEEGARKRCLGGERTPEQKTNKKSVQNKNGHKCRCKTTYLFIKSVWIVTKNHRNSKQLSTWKTIQSAMQTSA